MWGLLRIRGSDIPGPRAGGGPGVRRDACGYCEARHETHWMSAQRYVCGCESAPFLCAMGSGKRGPGSTATEVNQSAAARYPGCLPSANTGMKLSRWVLCRKNCKLRSGWFRLDHPIIIAATEAAAPLSTGVVMFRLQWPIPAHRGVKSGG